MDNASFGLVVFGSRIVRSEALVTIVDVISPAFTGVQQPVADAPDVAVPLALDPQLNTNPNTDAPRLTQPTYWWLQVMGRLKPATAGRPGSLA